MELMNFSAWLQAEMDRRGYTQAELARRSGLSGATVSLILSGERAPGARTCKALAHALGLPDITVLRAAGHVDEELEKPPRFAEWIHIFMQASPEQRERMLLVAEALAGEGQNTRERTAEKM